MHGRATWPALVLSFFLGTVALSPGCGAGTAATQTASSASSPPILLDLTAGATEESLQQYVGKQVTVYGHWGDVGKSGTGVRGERGDGVGVTVSASTDEAIRKKNRLAVPDGADVAVSGVLQFREMKRLPPPVDPKAPVTQPSDMRFYIDFEEASFSFPKRVSTPRGE